MKNYIKRSQYINNINKKTISISKMAQAYPSSTEEFDDTINDPDFSPTADSTHSFNNYEFSVVNNNNQTNSLITNRREDDQVIEGELTKIKANIPEEHRTNCENFLQYFEKTYINTNAFTINF